MSLYYVQGRCWGERACCCYNSAAALMIVDIYTLKVIH